MPGKSKEDILKIISGVKFMDRTFRLMAKGDGYLLQLSYYEADIETGKRALQKARKWYISPWMTETEIVETAFAACRRSMDHVLKEHFTYQGERVYSPHFDVQARLKMCKDKKFDSRPDGRPKVKARPKATTKFFSMTGEQMYREINSKLPGE